jgi:hypothetical protein
MSLQLCQQCQDQKKAVPPIEDDSSKPFVAVPLNKEQPYNPLVTDVDQSGSQPAKSKSSDQEVILVYLFIGGEAIEDAAKGLFLGEDPHTCSAAQMLQLQEEKRSPQS